MNETADLLPLRSGSRLLRPAEAAAQTLPLAPLVGALGAHGPFARYPGEVPVPLRLTLRTRNNPRVIRAVLDQAKTPRWQSALSEPGAGSVVLANDDADLGLLNEDALIMFELYGWAAFTLLPRTLERILVSPEEEAGQLTTVGGPGNLAILEEALVFPSRGPRRWPIEEDRVFSWQADRYDDSWWSPSWALAKWSDATVWTTDAQPGSPAAPDDFPDPDAEWMWAPGTDWMLAPGGTCYARVRFLVPDGTTAIKISFAFDWTGTLYLDGQEVGTNTWALDSWSTTTEEIAVTPGDHVLAVQCQNDFLDPADPNTTQNPGGILVSVAISSPGGYVGLPILRSGYGWKFLAYPETEPGMTPGEVIIACVTEAQWRGALGPVTWAFDRDVDSAGVPWPIVGDIATKVGYDVLTFVRELAGTYIDIAMAPGSFVLYAWVRGTQGEDSGVDLHAATDPIDPSSGNVANISHKRVL